MSERFAQERKSSDEGESDIEDDRRRAMQASRPRLRTGVVTMPQQTAALNALFAEAICYHSLPQNN